MSWTVKDKLCLVSGANSGLGYFTTEALAKAGARVVMLCRNADKAEAAKAQILASVPDAKLELLLADMGSLAAIRAACDRFKAEHEHLDLLVNNAGTMLEKHETSQDGYEMTFAVNHLAYMAVTSALLPWLRKGAPSRIVNVASRAHEGARVLKIPDKQGSYGGPYSGWEAYCQSKLMNIMFTYALAERLDPKAVTVNCLHPGVVATRFAHNNAGLLKWIWTLGRPFMRSAENGAKTSIYLSMAPELEGVTGKYFADSREVVSNRASRDKTAQKALWEASEAMIGGFDPPSA